jgi:ESCRT-I complex subunit TSG101
MEKNKNNTSGNNIKKEIKKTEKEILIEKINQRIKKITEEKTQKIENLFEIQQKLKLKQNELETTFEKLNNDNQNIMRIISDLENKSFEINEYIDEKKDKKINVDLEISAKDSLSLQILDLSSKDQAIDDVLFFLDKALEKKSIDLDSYLSTIRDLSKQQFFHRALLKKIFNNK